ncbi:uncharacterized protein LOC123538669 [Mercenaria mercenaria]|uniref:uncharacterized protein LOC123538669 n=1 Tax=Mercenaria mercenaria TaxID=6596 RepID=UPI00234E7962|nr:uncharacterized protein LOC123538669 [Mercenaria mercenaria]
MVGTCPDSYKENTTVIVLCDETVEPCTGTESSVIYKNKYCGKCNKELDCISWNINVECENADDFEHKMKSFSSITDMKHALDTNKCRIKFRPPGNNLGYPCSDPKYDYLSKVRVGKCNVSGFWETYDEDIDWACANFITPYKHFKNMFCYICNPSHANMQAVPLIDKCIPANNNFGSEINQACESFPVTDRLAPFKNIYCFVCSQGDTLLFEDNEYSLQHIGEENTLGLETRLNITILFSGELNLNYFKTFVDDFLATDFRVSHENTTPNKATQLNHYTTDFNDIVDDYKAVCGTRTLCNYKMDRNNTDKVYGNPVCKTCICDSICVESGSCCPDILLTRQPYSCYSPMMFSSFYKSEKLKATKDIRYGNFTTHLYQTIDKCINEDISSSKKEKCSNQTDTSDRLSRIPVSTEGNTYKNVYCYECNNNKSTITLKFQVLCKFYLEHKLFTNADRLLKAIKLYCDEISFVPVKNKLCPTSYDSEKASLRSGEKFVRRELHPSQFNFTVRRYMEINSTVYGKPVRNVFDKCNKTGKYRNLRNDVVKNICETDDVNILLLPEYRIDNKLYKNFACFLCNPEHDLPAMESDNVTSRCLSNTSVEWYVPNETLEDLCNGTEFHHRWYPYKNMYCAECNLPPWQLLDVIVLSSMVLPAAGYKYIFSLSPADFEHLDEVIETEAIPDCTSGTYDYALKRCRQLSCNDGFQLFNSTCKPVLQSAVRHEYSLSFNIHYSAEETQTLFNSTKSNMTLIVSFETLCAKVVNNITNSFGERTEHVVTYLECAASPCMSFEKYDVSEQFIDLVRMNIFRIQLTVLIMKTETLSIVHTVLLNSLNGQFYISDIQDIDGLPHTILIRSTPDITKMSDRLDINGCVRSQVNGNSDIESQQFSHYTVDSFLTCGQVKLNASEVCLDIESNNISLKNTNASFSDWEYKSVNNIIIICAEVYNTRTFIKPGVILVIRTELIKSVFIVFSFVCTIISLVCLFLTFITYCFIPSLRTIAGKNVMVLCISLFFSQALLQFGINATQNAALCVAIGISVHLSWLVSFCAMNICSFHTFKVFYYNRPAQNQSDNYLFLKYSLYIICFPIFLVLITIFASLLKSDASDIGYGKYYCFISDFYIFIFTFITPACLLFVSNIVFFSLAFHIIRSTPNVHGTRDRNHFYICLRLCTIVGIAWPLLIIDSSLGITWFSFIVAGVNALQGVFIFVSFVLNRRVASIFVSIISQKIGRQTVSTDTSGTKNTKSSPGNYRAKCAETN